MGRTPLNLPSKRARSNSNTSSRRLSNTDQKLYNLIKSKEGMGILVGDLKHILKLHVSMVRKSLNRLESMELIKRVVDVHHKSKKHYMAVEFEPAKEISGGPWYFEGKLDEELISKLKEECLKYINMQTIITNEGLFDCIRDGVKVTRRASKEKVEVTRDQILEIVQALVLENKIEELQSSGQGDFCSIPLGKVCYRRLNRTLSTAALTSIPCGVCPRIKECTPDGIISPVTCVYFKKWLEF